MRNRKKVIAAACAVCVLGGCVLPAQIRVPAAALETDPALEQLSVDEDQLLAEEDSSADEDVSEGGWREEDGRWCYYENGEKLLSQWIGEYYVDGEGWRVEDAWLEIDGYTYHFGAEGVKDVKQMIDDRYVDKNGRMITKKWKKVGNYYYYFAKDGVCKKDSWVDKKTYYVNAKGRRITNKWKKIGDYTYHFAKNGKKDTNKWIGNRYVDKNGRELKGVVKGTWEGSRFRKSDGSYAANGSYSINGTYYLFDGNGYLVTTTGWVVVNDYYYYNQPGGKPKISTWVSEELPPVDVIRQSLDKYNNGLWVNEKGQLVCSKSRAIKWEEKIVVGSGEGEYREGYYTLEPKDKTKPAYYQWVKNSNRWRDARPICKIKKNKKVTNVAFGVGEANNSWCLQVVNCVLTRQPDKI